MTFHTEIKSIGILFCAFVQGIYSMSCFVNAHLQTFLFIVRRFHQNRAFGKNPV